MTRRLFDLWCALLAYCEARETFDSKTFAGMIKEFSGWYKKASLLEQSDYHQMVKGERYEGL